MARAQFDRNEVIDKSIDLFWQNGFSASSMKEVVEATGLKPGSIYLAFGNKEGLFREALVRYAQQRVAQMHSVLKNAKSVGEGICTILEGVVEESGKKIIAVVFLLRHVLSWLLKRMTFISLPRLSWEMLNHFLRVILIKSLTKK